jgi:hypothetical protein
MISRTPSAEVLARLPSAINGVSVDVQEITNLSGEYSLQSFPHQRIFIEETMVDKEVRLGKSTGVQISFPALRFYTKLGRSELEKTKQLIDALAREKGFDPRVKRPDRGSYYAFYIRHVFARGLEHFSSVLLIAGNISNSANFDPLERYDWTLNQVSGPTKFQFSHDRVRFDAEKSAIRKLKIREIFDFLLRASLTPGAAGFSPFLRGVNYYVSALRSESNPALRMLLSISAIEALLLGSRLIDRQSQNMMVAARATAERKTLGHLS